MRRHQFVLWMALTLTSWNDDSGITVNAHPNRFSPLQQSANLVARVYHEVDVPMTIDWTMTIRDRDGRLRRVLNGSNEFMPGEPLQLAAVWDGRDEAGAIVRDGLYQVETAIEMRAKRRRRGADRDGERRRPVAHRHDHPGQEHELRRQLLMAQS